MKSLITSFVLVIYGVAIVGCEAHGGASVGDTNHDTTVREKSTTTYDNGGTSVKTTTVEKQQ